MEGGHSSDPIRFLHSRPTEIHTTKFHPPAPNTVFPSSSVQHPFHTHIHHTHTTSSTYSGPLSGLVLYFRIPSILTHSGYYYISSCLLSSAARRCEPAVPACAAGRERLSVSTRTVALRVRIARRVCTNVIYHLRVLPIITASLPPERRVLVTVLVVNEVCRRTPNDKL